MKCIVHENGTFDLIGEKLSLLCCFPSVSGRALCPIRTEASKTDITYHLQQGKVRLCFKTDGEGRLLLCCTAEGFAGSHDIAPLGASELFGADRVFVQGFGMEGPSGLFALRDAPPVSHGLTALCAEENVLLVYAEDHSRYSAAFQAEPRRNLFGETTLFSGGFNLEGTAGDRLTLPTLYLEETDNLAAGLRACAARIAKTMNARQTMPPAFFWSSWYHAYETMDQAGLEEMLEDMQNEQISFQYVELDAGYTPHLGDWLTPNHRWPGGLELAAETIRSAGFRAGIWVAPFIVGDRSDLYREHPDWVLHDLEGNPVVQLRCYTEPKLWGNQDCEYYVLDASHPEALSYLKTVFQTLKGWGYSFFKTDFMLWNMHDTATVRRHDPTKTSVEILRQTLDVIREAIGEESYLLGCIAPFMPFIGYADGMRLAGDCGAQWAEPFGPVNLLRELPFDNYFNHIFWQNDPDAILLRDFDTGLTPEEARSLALLQALSGGAVSTSDPICRLGEDRKRLLRLVEPHGEVTPQLPFLGKARTELVLTHQLSQGNVLFVMNPTDSPLTVFCRLRELFGKEDWYQTRYVWEGQSPESVRDDVFAEVLAPHASALLFVTRAPLREMPANLWQWKP